MKKTIIYCDKCEQEIGESPDASDYRLDVAHRRTEAGSIDDAASVDLCHGCALKELHHVLSGTFGSLPNYDAGSELLNRVFDTDCY